jgi:hypothetical protein
MNTRVSRNSLCPCGSGRKFKFCCLSVQQAPRQFQQPVMQKRLLAALPIVAALSRKSWKEVVFDAPLANGGRLHVVLLFSDHELLHNPFRAREPITLDLSQIRFRGPATIVGIRPTNMTGEAEAEVLRCVWFRNDDDLGTVLHGEWTPSPKRVERWRSRRREIVLRMDYPDGSWSDIRLLRTVQWIEEAGARVGETIFLELSEVGTRGWAKVLEILPCGPIEMGPGEIVTGEFRHSAGTVGELVLDSEPEPLGVTPGHLFWSEERQAWVPVSHLRTGETLLTSSGAARVVSYTLSDRVEPVYNLEVQHDHCYRVGEKGVLVHNTSAGAAASQGTRNPNQTCCDERLDELQTEKNRICNSTPGESCSSSKVSPKRLARRPCSEIRTRLESLRKCYIIRKQIQDECFGGMPDPAHKNALQETQNGIDSCIELEKENCAPGHPMAEM